MRRNRGPKAAEAADWRERRPTCARRTAISFLTSSLGGDRELAGLEVGGGRGLAWRDRGGAYGSEDREGGAGPERGPEAGGDAGGRAEVAVGREDRAADRDREHGTEALRHVVDAGGLAHVFRGDGAE